jgi:non-ribosomal peptide synthetase component F
MALLAAFKTLLHRYTAESEIVVGAARANRNRAEIDNLTGCFTDMLPMRTDLRGNPRFTQLLVKDAALGAYIHQEAPVETLVEEAQPARPPLFNIAFGVQRALEEEAPLTGIKIGPAPIEHELARFDLTLWITQGAQAMKAAWIYNADLFEEETITRLHNHFETLLSSVVARPNSPLDELEMLSEAERAQQTINRAIRKEYDYSRFKSVKPKVVVTTED